MTKLWAPINALNSWTIWATICFWRRELLRIGTSIGFKHREQWSWGILELIRSYPKTPWLMSFFGYTGFVAFARLTPCRWKLTTWVIFTLIKRGTQVPSSQGGQAYMRILDCVAYIIEPGCPPTLSITVPEAKTEDRNFFSARGITNLNTSVQSLWHKCGYCYCRVIYVKCLQDQCAWYFASGPGFSILPVS